MELDTMKIPDAWLVSGCLTNTVWNVLCERDPVAGIKDYDVFYFDPDTSWEAEDRVIQQCAKRFAHVSGGVEVRNQARVHLWAPGKFGRPAMDPFMQSSEGIDGFLTACTMVGARLNEDKEIELYTPVGLADVFSFDVRSNPLCSIVPQEKHYWAKARRWKEQWPELTLHDPI